MAYFGQVKQLEDTIIKTQQELSAIMLKYHQGGEDNAVLSLQIAHCKENLAILQRQVTELESKMTKDAAVVGTPAEVPVYTAGETPAEEPVFTPVEEIPAQPVFVQQEVQPNTAQPVTQPTRVQTAPTQTIPVKPAPTKEKRSMETMLGKSGMGIMASGLIFISFVLFAALLYPKLTDTIKMISMYVVSFVFLGLGLFKLRKKENHPLWLSVAGCGVGGLYISLLLSDIMFKAMNDIVLYICLLVWCIGVCYLAKRKSFTFQIIGYIGILISVYLGAGMCNKEGNTAMMLFLVIYTIAALLIFQITHLDRTIFEKNWPAIAAELLTAIPLLALNKNTFWFGDIVLLVFYALQLGYVLFTVKPKENNLFAGISLAFNFAAVWHFLIICLATPGRAFQIVGSLVLLVIVHILFERMKWQRRDSVYCLLTVLLTLCYVGVGYAAYGDPLKWQIPVIVVSYVYLLLALWGKLDNYKRLSLIPALAFVFWIFMNGIVSMVVDIVCVLIFAGMFYIAAYKKTEYYDAVFIYAGYLITQILLVFALVDITSVYTVEFETALFFILLVTGALNLAVMGTKLFYNPIEKVQDPKLYMVSVVINKIMMCITWIAIAVAQKPWFILLAVLFFSATTVKLLKKQEFWISSYVGVKYTLLVVSVMMLYEVEGAPVSIVFFLVAIISIILGFTLRKKGLRVYGLILSLISVVKLVVMDIDYGNAVARAFSFFVCGVLCFVISFIYNLVDKRMSAE